MQQKFFIPAKEEHFFCNDKELYHKLYYSHNFGHNGPLDFHGLGINAKISELQSAMGLAVFENINYIFQERKKVVDYYLKTIDFSKVSTIKIRENTKWNYSYFPIIFNSEDELLKTQQRLNESNIFPRRYFYPSLNTINFVKGNSMPISESIASRILCLPLYVGLFQKDLEKIVKLI